MPTLPEIRAALRAVLPDELDITIATGPTSGSESESPTRAMGESPPRRFHVKALTGPAHSEDSQLLADELLEDMGERSIRALLEADRSLGGVVGDLTVISTSGWREYRPPGAEPQLGVEWTVEITT